MGKKYVILRNPHDPEYKLFECVPGKELYAPNGATMEDCFYFQDPKTGLFNIRKRIKGKTEHFGAYKKEEEAKLAIQIFKKTGWHKEDRWVVKAEVKERLGM